MFLHYEYPISSLKCKIRKKPCPVDKPSMAVFVTESCYQHIFALKDSEKHYAYLYF